MEAGCNICNIWIWGFSWTSHSELFGIDWQQSGKCHWSLNGHFRAHTATTQWFSRWISINQYGTGQRLIMPLQLVVFGLVLTSFNNIYICCVTKTQQSNSVTQHLVRLCLQIMQKFTIGLLSNTREYLWFETIWSLGNFSGHLCWFMGVCIMG